MGIIGKLITGAVVSVGSELILKRALPAAIRKGKKYIRELEKEEEAKKKGE